MMELLEARDTGLCGCLCILGCILWGCGASVCGQEFGFDAIPYTAHLNNGGHGGAVAHLSSGAGKDGIAGDDISRKGFGQGGQTGQFGDHIHLVVVAGREIDEINHCGKFSSLKFLDNVSNCGVKSN